MQETKSELVLPGDFIGTSEEFLPGPGTYEADGSICAANVGIVQVNSKERSVSVLPRTDVPPIPNEGNIVIGRILDLKGSVALVDIACIKGQEDRAIAIPEQGAIHISNVKNAYVKDLSYEFGYQDIVRAKVIDAKTLRLSTDGRDLGVIKAFCSKCTTALKRKGDKLECPKCKHTETRKIAEDYGSGIV